MASKDREHIRKLREEANALRLKEEARKRRNRMFTQIGIVVGAIVVIGAIVLLVVMGPKWFGNQQVPESSGTVAITNSEGQEVEVPIAASNDGIVVGLEDAPVTVDYYFDFSCPHCQDYHEVLGGDIEQVIADGSAKVNFHMIRFVSEYGLVAGAATAAVVEYQPELFFTVMDGLFAIPAETQATMSYGDYATQVAALGVTSQEALQAIENGDFSWWMSDRTNQARTDGVQGTPSLFIDGEYQETLPTSGDELRAVIAAASGEAAPAPAETEPAETEPAESAATEETPAE
ncbi:thioredoxin domain-containing protein [Gulosibacter chungangensis]|uniref:Thioredoxin domain-containing protein n=1 Tax=Gulosibacter chungangensis TaxID=979746 RepID=A0A7J5B8M3_9MICO|nr:thioredoxin domain-containing protein [Gulosibacter chungangensis]KAB1641148.1 thioredoxin domain-containing protein [Gulosibacter chungangensis]